MMKIDKNTVVVSRCPVPDRRFGCATMANCDCCAGRCAPTAIVAAIRRQRAALDRLL
jgi:hypothetical protein